MERLLALSSTEQREHLAQDLVVLARHYFDFCPRELSKLEGQQRLRVRELYPKPFLELLGPALVPGEGTQAAQRVQEALARDEEKPVDVENLRQRFESAARAAGAGQNTARVFDDLVQRYGQASRHYHTLEHVSSCLAWLDWCYGLAERPAEVALALWFHDAVYELGASDNEQRSAELARCELRGMGVPAETCERIASCIEATETHVASGDAALVVDIDLAILGARSSDYERFEQQIRDEYAAVEGAAFVAGRRAVLQRFLTRPAIYQVPQMREALERPARANLERRIRELCQAERARS